jgi:hypothetical protein
MPLKNPIVNSAICRFNNPIRLTVLLFASTGGVILLFAGTGGAILLFAINIDHPPVILSNIAATIQW